MSRSARNVFVSYRRDDAGGYAGRLGDALADHFGADHVFLDVVSISPGDDFVSAIRDAIAACDVFVPVIGPGWADSVDGRGSRRLDDPDDVVRLEIEAALEQDVPVVPVLVGNASMPPVDGLPPTLGALARRNAVEISSARWVFDVSRLIASLVGDAADDELAWVPPRDLQYAHRDVRASHSRPWVADRSSSICRAGLRTSSGTTGTRRTTAGWKIFRERVA